MLDGSIDRDDVTVLNGSAAGHLRVYESVLDGTGREETEP